VFCLVFELWTICVSG